MTNKPIYHDGKPTNLQAAALASPASTPGLRPGQSALPPVVHDLGRRFGGREGVSPKGYGGRLPLGDFVDALDWLRVVARQPKDPRIKDAVWNENLFRLRLAIQALEEFLPDQEH